MTVNTHPSPSLSAGCRLVATDGRQLPLRSVDVAADAGGGLARVRLRQTFVNPYAEPLAVTYLLPLPADGAVVDFAFVLGGQRIAGRVERKADARAAFEQAVIEGRTAALLEQERSSLFTQELGNLPAGAELGVEIDVEQPLAWVDGGWEWRWPTVVGPRYLGSAGETPDAARVTVDVADSGIAVRCSASVVVSDAMTGAPSSPSHPVAVGADGIALTGALDRDVVVRWPVAAPAPGVVLEVARPVGDDAYGLVTLVPPVIPGPPVPRDLCLLLDTSGSMGGAPLTQLKAFSKALVQGLREGDQLELIEFSSSPRRWRAGVVRVDARSRAEALKWLAGLSAGGGTAMHEAVTEALAPIRPEALRQVVLVTDGYIGFEQEVIGRIRRALPRGSRIHTVGIGSAVNRSLTGGVARAGGGQEVIVAPDEAVGPAVGALLARTGDPLWVDVVISGTAVREVAPATIHDLLAGAPARVAVRLDPAGGTLVVSGRTAAGPVTHELGVAAISTGQGRRVIATRFAREAVEDLEVARAGGAGDVDGAIEALGLKHRIATRLTSWVAATEEVTVDPGDPTRRERMPHVLPHGVSAEGVGLRPMMSRSAPMPPPPVSAPAPGGAPMAQPARSRMMKRKMEAEPVQPVMQAGEIDVSREERAAKPSDSLAAPELERVVVRTLRARIVSLADGRIVLEFDVAGPLVWDPSAPVVVDADGNRIGGSPVFGTTRAGVLVAGQVGRLVLGWTGAAPVRIEVGDLVLVVA